MRASIIGLGRIGFSFGLEKNRVQPASHVACYLSLPSITDTDVALCDSDPEKLASAKKALAHTSYKEPNVNYYADVNQMLTEFQPEIVSVCTPTPTHASLVMTVADCLSVKTVFLEKPIAQSLQEADAIIEACERHNIHLAVNYARRWSKVYGDIKHKAILKKPVIMIGVHPGPLIRTGTHMLDLFNWLADPEDFCDVDVQAIGNVYMEDY